MPDPTAAILAQLDALIDEHSKGYDNNSNFYALRTRGLAAIERLAPPDSAYVRDAQRTVDTQRLNNAVHEIAAILKTLRAD